MLASAALPAAAASHDYFVHGEAYNPQGGGFQPSHITIDSLNGDTLVVPDAACGMRFEGDFTMQWRSNNGALVQNIPTGGAANVWLPSAGCGAWQGVTVETDGGDTYIPPFDFSGRIETDATAYWINSAGDKLVYLYQPCHPMPDCVLASQAFVPNSWSYGLRDSIRELRAVQFALHRGDRTALALLAGADDALRVAARTMMQRVKSRRAVNTGSLERSMRQLEAAALARLASARNGVGVCRTELTQGRVDQAYRACGEALGMLQFARVALDTGDAWIE